MNLRLLLVRAADWVSSARYIWMFSASGSKMNMMRTLSLLLLRSRTKVHHLSITPHVGMGANNTIVVYRDRTVMVSNPTDFPDTTNTGAKFKEVLEPVVKASIIVPQGLSFWNSFVMIFNTVL